MPYPIANLSKRAIRPDVAAILGDNWPLESSSAGNVGGTTGVFSSLIGVPIASVQNKYLLIEEGTNDAEYRSVSSFAPATGTPTVRRAYTGQVASGISAHLHEFSPHLYTLGINAAIRECYRALYRPVLHHTFVRQPGVQRTLPLPRVMERVMRIMEDSRSSEKLRDYFDRTASSSDPGSKWTPSVGTWGVTAEGLYCVSDTDGDLLLAATNPQVKNGVLEALVRGDTTASHFRVFSLIFRYEDANYLFVRVLNGAVELYKRDGGTETIIHAPAATTTENVDYLVRVMFNGSWVSVFFNDTPVIMKELTGSELKFLGYDESGTGTYGNVGIRLDKTGSPSLAATATRISHYFLHELVGRVERGDWERTADGRMIELRTRGRGWGLSEGRMLWLEGMCPLSGVPEDTAFETITSDTTDVVELQKTLSALGSNNPEYDVLVQWAAAVVLRYAAQPAHTNNPEKRKEYAALAADQMARAERVRARSAMRYHMRAWS